MWHFVPFVVQNRNRKCLPYHFMVQKNCVQKIQGTRVYSRNFLSPNEGTNEHSRKILSVTAGTIPPSRKILKVLEGKLGLMVSQLISPSPTPSSLSVNGQFCYIGYGQGTCLEKVFVSPPFFRQILQ